MAIIGIPISNRQEIGNSLSAINNAFTELDLRFNDILTTAGGTFVGGVTAANMVAPYMSAGNILGYGGLLTGLITESGGTATGGVTATSMVAPYMSGGILMGYGGFLRGLNGYPSAIGQFDYSLTAPYISGVDAVFTRSVTTSAGSFASHLSAQRIYGKFFGDGSGLFNINNAGSSLTVGASAFVPTMALETLVSNYDPLYSNVTVLTRNSGPNGSLPIFLTPSTAVVSVSGTTGTAGLSSKYVKFNNSSLYFDSPGYLPATGGLINKYVKVENANMFNVGTSTVFTLEFWIYVGEYPKTSQGDNPSFASLRSAALVDTFSKQQQTSAGAFCIGLRGDGTLVLHTVNGSYTTSATIPLNKWTHVAFERYSSFLYFNVDGVRTTIVANGTISLTPPANVINIGSSPWISGIFSGGEYGLIDTAISEFRITVGATRYAAATFNVPSGYFSYKNANNVAVNTSLLVTDNVGIGTNTPGSKLHVVGSAVQFELSSTGGASFFADNNVKGPSLQMSGLSGSYIDLSSTLTGAGTSGSIGDYGLRIANWVDQTNNNTRISFLNANQTDLALMTNDTTKLIIKNNGNVGIGTSTPSAKLAVGGDITITEGLTGKNNLITDFLAVGGSRTVGDVWIARAGTRNWNGIAMSSDGTKQTAVASLAQIQVSTDSGVTWTPKDIANYWRSIAMSSDGTKQTALVNGGQIFVSYDSGNTWTPRDFPRNWYSIAMSSGGGIQTAIVFNGQIYVSNDNGFTWAPKEFDRPWHSIAMSSDGARQTAVAYSGQIYISTDYGNTWTPKETNRNWNSIAMSSDGARQTAGVFNGQIYVSTDYGNTWTPKDSNRKWISVAMSSRGNIQTAAVYEGQLYISFDFGNTWTPKESNRYWNSIAMSSDGNKQAATAYNAPLYTSTGSILTITANPETGNVGIGTSTPGDKLEVNGNIHSKNTTQFSGFAVKNATNTVGYLIGSSATNDNGALGLLSGGVDRVSIQASGNSYFNGGNVGIGNNNPGSHLTLGTVGAVPEFALAMQNSYVRMSQRNTNNEFGITTNFTTAGGNDTARPSWGLFMGAGTGNVDCFNIKRGAAGANSQTTLMWLTSAGRLGIGTTAPTDQLHVTATNGTFATGTKPIGWGGGITTWDLYAGGTVGTGSETGVLSGYMTQSGNAWFANNLGVGPGAYSPAFDLHVSKSKPGQLVEAKLENISTANNTAARYTLATSIPNHYALWEVHTNASAPTVNFASGDGTTSGMFFTAGNTVTNHPMVFRQGATERLRIESTGAVTVNNVLRLNAGTDGDSGMLSDAGSLSGVYIKFNAVDQSGSTDWAYLRQIGNRADDFHLALDLHDNENHATAGQSFSIRNVASTQTPDVAETRFIVNGLGNVGIGTSTPAATLGLNGVMLIGNQTNTGSLPDIGSIRVLAASQGNFIQSGQNTSTNSAAPLIFSTINNGTEWMRISEAGNVGIGTNSPSSKLTVAGGSELGLFTGTRDSNGYAGIRIQNTSATTAPTLQSQTFLDFGNGSVNVSNMHSVMATDGSANLYFSTTPAGSKSVDRRVPRLTITGDGRVGVNTSTPSSYLDVASPTGTVDEGGEIRLRPAAGYSFDYWMDIWQNNFRLFRSDTGGNLNTSALLNYNPNAGNLSLFDAAVQIAPGGYDDTNWAGANNNPIRYATQVVVGGKIASVTTFSAAAYKYPAIPYSHGHSYIDIVNDNFADYHSRIVRWNAPPGDQYRDVGSPVDGDLNIINTGKGYVYNIIEGGSRVTGSTFVWRHHTQDSAISLFAGAFGVAGFTNATGTASRFNTPRGVTVDPSGNIYVSESGAIRRLTSVGVTTTLAGDGSFGTADGTGAAARFNNARGMVVDSTGTFLYVCDASNHSIRRINLSTAAVTTFAGLNGTSGTTDGTGTAARFNTPTCITRDSSNNLYVTDTGNHTIRKITPAGVVTTIAGLAGSIGSTNGTGTAARFNNPRGIALVDYWKWIFVTDAGNHVIRKIDYSGANVQVTTLAGTAGSTGSLDGLGAAARFNNPTGITYTNDNYLWVADLGNHLIRRVVMWNGLTNTFAGTAGTAGGQDGYMQNALLNGVRDIVYNPGNSTAYFVEETNHTVRTFTVKTKDIASMTPDGWVLAESGFQTNWTGSNNSPYMIRMVGDQINSAPTATEEATTSLGSAGQLALNAATDQSKFRNTTIYNGKGGIIAGFVGSNGNMGIGTITPAYKLDVSGDIIARSGWLRSSGDTGWYNDTYGGGWYMTDSTFIRNYNSKQVYINNALTVQDAVFQTVTYTTKTFAANTWYRFFTFESTNNGQTATIVLRNPGGHDSVEIKLSKHTTGKGELGVIAEVRRLGSFAYTRNITAIRIVDEGTNQKTHLEVKLGDVSENTTFKAEIKSFCLGAGYSTPDMVTGINVTGITAREVVISDGVDSTSNQTLLGICTLSQDIFYIKGNSRVGIATANPTERLHVNGSVRVETGNVVIDNNQYLILGSNNCKLYKDTFYNGVILEGGAGELFIGLTSGNFGIGTKTPAHKLDVSGTVRCTDLIVTGSITANSSPSPSLPSVITKTASGTLAITDASNILYCTNSSAITLTIPLNSSVNFPIGTQIIIEQEGVGTVTITGVSGVDLKSYANRFTTAGQYSVITLIKVGTDSWRLGGNLA